MRFKLAIETKHSSLLLGITLRYARLKAGLSLRDMGELANISHTLIANIEHGKTVGNHETMRDMFAILHMTYRDDESLKEEFCKRYDRVFNHLYHLHYDRTKEDMEYLANEEETYASSIVFIDYYLLRLFHAALTDTMTLELEANIDLMKRVSDLLSDRQQQLQHVIIGIHLYNQGQYHAAYQELLLALQKGDARFDPLTNLFIVRSMVKMFMFMDAQKIAERTIKQFEEQLNYQRAMQLRLALAYSHISLKKFDDALVYIEYVEDYSLEYQDKELLQACLDNRLSLYMMKGDYDQIETLLHRIQTETVTTIIAELVQAGIQQDTDMVHMIYQKYLEFYKTKLKQREFQFITGMVMVYQGMDYTEDEFIQLFADIIEDGRKTLDQELLMFAYDSLIEFYRNKRLYKKALELSEDARQIRSYGLLVNHNQL
jgi:transcriptional regulator with XRE-family HTH domain